MLDDRAEARIVRGERRVDRVLARRRPRAARAGAASPASRSAARAASRPPWPRSAAVAAQAAPSPSRPSARACAQSERSAARSATAATEPVAATRTSPCARSASPSSSADVVVGRGEQPRAAVVEEVPLVDRLHAEREPPVRDERREHGHRVLLGLGSQRGRPERALRGRPGRDLLEEAHLRRRVEERRRPRQASASTCSSLWARRREQALELRGRQIDALREQVTEERAEPLRVATQRRPRSARTGPSRQKSVSIAPTRCTVPNGASPSSRRAPRRSSSS